MNYSDIYNELTYNMGIVIFAKKDGTIRVMVCTRDLDIAKINYGWISGELNKMNSRCNIDNKNLAVIDLSIGEGRCFNTDRLIYFKSLGKVTTLEQFNELMGVYLKFAQEYKALNTEMISLGKLDDKPEIKLPEINVASVFGNSGLTV